MVRERGGTLFERIFGLVLALRGERVKEKSLGTGEKTRRRY